jgi:2-polyprenyl-6-methoxyphenol hydroxylase-like FAD-dependent oxidoreductase
LTSHPTTPGQFITRGGMNLKPPFLEPLEYQEPEHRNRLRAQEAFATTTQGRIRARFEDGSSAEGDVLVGADGASSRVRWQLLPQAQRIDTGLIGLSGKVPLQTIARRDMLDVGD